VVRRTMCMPTTTTTLGSIFISPSRVSPFNHIGTLPLQRKHSQPRVLFFYPFTYRRSFLNGTHLPRTLVKKTFDTRTILHSFEPVLTISSDTIYFEKPSFLLEAWLKTMSYSSEETLSHLPLLAPT